jgi:hypothetical protein
MSFMNLLKPTPFIVNTRNSKELLKNLLVDDAPIIFEGLHTCYFLNQPELKHRKRIVRTHNVEHDYYANLSKAEHKFFQKIYLKIEAGKLKKYEHTLAAASALAAISGNDELHFKEINPHTTIVSAFHQNTTVTSKVGRGEFVLYHGNLGVAENYNAAIYLCEQVFSKNNFKLVIAGNNAPEILRKVCNKYPNVELVEKLSTEKIIDLVSQAHINILITQQATGIKLKLLAALYNGRHCIVNNEMVLNTGLEKYCEIANDAQEMNLLISKLFEKDFSVDDVILRKQLEHSIFSNAHNVNKLISLISN